MARRPSFHRGQGHRPGQTSDDLREFDLEQMERESEEILKLRYLSHKNAVFSKTDGGFVDLKTEDRYYARVVFYRSFPFSDPNFYISVREPDEKAREIGIIKNLTEDFKKDVVAIINEQMNLRYFTPKIKKINAIKEEYGYAYFDVVTDHGDCRFTANAGGNAIISLSDARLIITDLDGNRFEIQDVNKLSAKELKKLDVFL